MPEFGYVVMKQIQVLVTYCGDFMSWLPLWVQLVLQTLTSRMKNFKTRSQDTDVTKNKHASQKNTIPDRKRAASEPLFREVPCLLVH